MKVKTYTVLISEKRINTHYKNILIKYTKSDNLTKRLLLLPVGQDKNGLLFTKQVHMAKTIIGYSYARTILNSTPLCGTHQAYVYINIIFDRFNSSMRLRK